MCSSFWRFGTRDDRTRHITCLETRRFDKAAVMGLFTVAVMVAALAAGLTGCGSTHRAPVVMIGLDGADFNLLVPWMEQGELPNLKAFLDAADVGELTTVYPILSPVCWTSGRHRREPRQARDLRLPEARSRRGRAAPGAGHQPARHPDVDAAFRRRLAAWAS